MAAGNPRRCPLQSAQWSNGRRDNGGRPHASSDPRAPSAQPPVADALRASVWVQYGSLLAAARPPLPRASMRPRSSSARADRNARMPLPSGAVKSSHCRSKALNVAPRAATRSMIRMPSSIERAARSHSAKTNTSPGPKAPIALSSSRLFIPSRPGSFSPYTRLQPSALSEASWRITGSRRFRKINARGRSPQCKQQRQLTKRLQKRKVARRT
jgi:hypothetical protein